MLKDLSPTVHARTNVRSLDLTESMRDTGLALTRTLHAKHK